MNPEVGSMSTPTHSAGDPNKGLVKTVQFLVCRRLGIKGETYTNLELLGRNLYFLGWQELVPKYEK